MSMHKTAKCLTMIAMGFALSGCLLDAKEPVTVANESQTLVTPWGAPSSTRSTATSSNDSNLVMMEDANRKALDQIQQKQIDEARIALGILDRMAKRCVQDGDAAACATLQTNWAPLSQQLHKTLSMMAGDSMQMPMTDPSNDPSMVPANDSPPRPQAPATSAPAGDSDTPTMEKIIPMSSSGSDG